MIVNRPLSLIINGEKVGPTDVPEGMMMIDFLHEYQNLTGSRFGCGQGICQACSIIIEHSDGQLEKIQTCITGAHYFEGKSIRTIEGHAERDANGSLVKLTAVQEAFIENFSFQCGYCTPGFVAATTVLLDTLKRKQVSAENLDKAIEDALGAHICRCTGYVRYYTAVRALILKSPDLIRS